MVSVTFRSLPLPHYSHRSQGKFWAGLPWSYCCMKFYSHPLIMDHPQRKWFDLLMGGYTVTLGIHRTCSGCLGNHLMFVLLWLMRLMRNLCGQGHNLRYGGHSRANSCSSVVSVGCQSAVYLTSQYMATSNYPGRGCKSCESSLIRAVKTVKLPSVQWQKYRGEL